MTKRSLTLLVLLAVIIAASGSGCVSDKKIKVETNSTKLGQLGFTEEDARLATEEWTVTMEVTPKGGMQMSPFGITTVIPTGGTNVTLVNNADTPIVCAAYIHAECIETGWATVIHDTQFSIPSQGPERVVSIQIKNHEGIIAFIDECNTKLASEGKSNITFEDLTNVSVEVVYGETYTL